MSAEDQERRNNAVDLLEEALGMLSEVAETLENAICCIEDAISELEGME